MDELVTRIARFLARVREDEKGLSSGLNDDSLVEQDLERGV